MARGDRSGRKPANDSLRGQLAQAQAEDCTLDTAPTDVPGWSTLGRVGRNTYDQYYRQRPVWTLADLVLICQAARCHEQIIGLELQSVGMPAVFVNKATGGMKANPIPDMIAKLQLQIRNCLRDAGLRGKDGHEPIAPFTCATNSSAETGFTDWDSLLMS
jgi:hypothetical protein